MRIFVSLAIAGLIALTAPATTAEEYREVFGQWMVMGEGDTFRAITLGNTDDSLLVYACLRGGFADTLGAYAIGGNAGEAKFYVDGVEQPLGLILMGENPSIHMNVVTNQAIVDALVSGSTAEAVAGSASVKFSLSGSRRAIETAKARCDG